MGTGPYPGDSLRKLQLVELEILLVLDELCRANGLTYWLDSGSCLGAIRHGGFIPWDDDADIGMPIEDYLRFLEIAPRALPEGFSLHTCLNTPGFSALWAKVYRDGTRFIDENSSEAGSEQGIFVDVFPYCPRDKERGAAQRRNLTTLQRLSYLKHIAHPKIPKGTPAKPLIAAGLAAFHHTIGRLISQKRIAKHFHSLMEVANPDEEWMSACYAYAEPRARQMLLPTAHAEFEGHSFNVPHDCDAYLKRLYGNYMELPPEDARYTHLPVILDFGDGVNVMEGTRSS